MQLASAPLMANSRISRGRINSPFAKYARTIRSAMRDPEISPWQSSCFRRPLARGGPTGVGADEDEKGGGGAEGRRMRECKGGRRGGDVAGKCVPVKSRDSPPRSRSLTCPLARISPGAHERPRSLVRSLARSLACRSNVPCVNTRASRRAGGRIYNRSLSPLSISLRKTNEITLRFIFERKSALLYYKRILDIFLVYR